MAEHPRQLVNDISEIRSSIAAFHEELERYNSEAGSLARSTTYWVYDPDADRFGPSEFVGFKAMNFERYILSQQGKVEGVLFSGGLTRQAIEKVLQRDYKADSELSNKLKAWGEKLFGNNWWAGIKDYKWKFVSLPAGQSKPAAYVTESVIKKLVALVRKKYPAWKDFSDPDYIRDEFEYKRAHSQKVKELLDRETLIRLMADHRYDEMIQQIEKAGQSNLLFLARPKTADLSVLYAENLDKPAFCHALFEFLYGSGTIENRFKAYMDYLDRNALPNKWAFPTFLLYMLYPEEHIFVKPRPSTWLMRLLGLSVEMTGKPSPSDYRLFDSIARELFEMMEQYKPRNLIDIQSLIWVSHQAVKANTIGYWWVNQGQSFETEKEPNLLWAPYRNQSGATYYHWDNVSKVKKGDIILHYFRQNIIGISQARSDPAPSDNPYKEHPEWSANGRKVDVAYYGLDPGVPLNRINRLNELLASPKGPMNQNGGIKQGYLFNITPQAFHAIVQAAPEVNWPSFVDTGSTEELNEEQTNMESEAISIHPLNMILYGPPGTGKTYSLYERAVAIADPGFKAASRSDLMNRYKELRDAGQIQFVTFHQSYSYEEFIEGIRPCLDEEGETKYELRDGVLKQIARLASAEFTHAEHSVRIDYDNISFFKMSLGRAASEEDEEIFAYCIQNGYVSLGWGEDIDFSEAAVQRDPEKRRQLVEKLYVDAPSNKAVSMVSTFIGGMQKGDMVFVSNGNKSIRAIGIVTGDYEYLPDTEIRYSQFRRVKWLMSEDVDVPIEKLYSRGLSMRALYEFDRANLDMENLKKLLNGGSPSKKPENYVLIIDEINRGNISKIFGEVITLLDSDKRLKVPNATTTTLPYSQKPFGLPSNLYILGTMNTADRSIALMDVALRRRFHFEELMPSGQVIRRVLEEKGTPSSLVDLVTRVFDVLNRRIEVLYDRDHQIGHSYFLEILTASDLCEVWNKKILPLVQEYFYNDWDRLARLLGLESNGGFVRSLSDRDGYRELFNGEDVEYPSEIVIYEDPEELIKVLERAF